MPSGVTLASPLRRLAGYLLDLFLAFILLYVFYSIWSLFTYADGQTPAKKLLGMRVVIIQNSRPAGWWRMFLREFIARPVVAVLSSLTFGIVLFWLIWDSDSQQLWDKIVGTIVVYDPYRQVS